jgi:hypothetical protein
VKHRHTDNFRRDMEESFRNFRRDMEESFRDTSGRTVRTDGRPISMQQLEPVREAKVKEVNW